MLKCQVAGYCEKVAAVQDKRLSLYHSFEEALLKLKANKDTGSFQSAAKKITGKQSMMLKIIIICIIVQLNIRQRLPSLLIYRPPSRLWVLSWETRWEICRDWTNKSETTKYNRYHHDDWYQLITWYCQGALVERLVAGKISKQPFIDQEGSIIRKKQDALEKIINIVRAF